VTREDFEELVIKYLVGEKYARTKIPKNLSVDLQKKFEIARSYFKQLDTNKDGMIETGEVSNLLTDIFKALSKR